MTEKQKAIAAQVGRLIGENARLRVALTEIVWRCERTLEFRDLTMSSDSLDAAITNVRDLASKALNSKEAGTLTVKKGDQHS